jgi:hypothetical protein
MSWVGEGLIPTLRGLGDFVAAKLDNAAPLMAPVRLKTAANTNVCVASVRVHEVFDRWEAVYTCYH